MKPRLAFTMGDPSGIGPEVTLRALADERLRAVCEPVLICAPEVLEEAASVFGSQPDCEVEEIPGPGAGFAKGKVSAEGGLCAYRGLMRAIDLALLGEVAGIVTAPLSKLALHLAGIRESGQTEILARSCEIEEHALMLVSERLACGFVTCHQSLASVSGSLSVERVVTVASLMHGALANLRGRVPKLGLLALNPHAGEEGLFGDEEQRILVPAARLARQRGIDLSDPIPADVAFLPRAIARYDGYVSQYHDQGGIPFKMLCFDEGVNMTLGLPFVRTSPDHGTAHDLAWKGEAKASSMIAAGLLAARLTGAR